MLGSYEALGVKKYMAKHHSFVHTHYTVGMMIMITIRYGIELNRAQSAREK